MQRSIQLSRPSSALVRTLTSPPVGREPPAHHDVDEMVPAPSRHRGNSQGPALPNIVAPGVTTPASGDRRASQEVGIPKPRVQPYAHRTFMGLAGSMLLDPTWSARLQRCMPELHGLCTAPGVSIARAMRLLEGNPVLAAYGLSRGENKSLPMEWDLWLDPKHPGDLALARVIHGNDTASELAHTPEGRTVEVATAIMAGRAAGTDVHEGLTPLRWLEVFGHAARDAGLSGTCGAVYLDVKSAWSLAADVAAFIAALQNHQVETRGVLAFDFEQLAHPLNVPKAVYLTHSPAGLAMALPSIPRGASAMFNGGALLKTVAGRASIDHAQLALVRRVCRERDLRLGVYLQEDGVSPESLRVLIDCINREADTFADGIAYGGLAGVAEGLVREGTGTGCQASVIDLENARWLARLHTPGNSGGFR